MNGLLETIIVAVIATVIAAGVIAAIVYVWKGPKRKRRKELIEIMGRAIQHRNIGDRREFADEEQWVRQAGEIETEAEEKAKKLGDEEGSKIEWLDRVDPWDETSEVERMVSILSKVIERIREIL